MSRHIGAAFRNASISSSSGREVLLARAGRTAALALAHFNASFEAAIDDMASDFLSNRMPPDATDEDRDEAEEKAEDPPTHKSKKNHTHQKVSSSGPRRQAKEMRRRRRGGGGGEVAEASVWVKLRDVDHLRLLIDEQQGMERERARAREREEER